MAEPADRLDHALPDLRRLAVSLCAQLGRHGEAAEWAWQDFAASPSVERYQQLREHAEHDGSWGRWRTRALAELRQQRRVSPTSVGPRSAGATRAMMESQGHSVLVKVLLGEGDIPAAWEAALDGGCTEAVWLTLARQGVLERPLAAIAVFRRQAEAAIAGTRSDSYQQAASLLTDIGACYERIGASAELVEYVRQLRATHRRRRSLIAALDAARLPGL